jgi:hypothetical protein
VCFDIAFGNEEPRNAVKKVRMSRSITQSLSSTAVGMSIASITEHPADSGRSRDGTTARLGLQMRPDDRLGDPVRNGGHPYNADTLASSSRYLHRPDRRREYVLRTPISDLEKVPFQVFLEVCDRLPSTPAVPWLALTFS